MSVSDTVYVAGLPPDATEQELAQYFGQTGAVKTDQRTGLPSVWIYKDLHTGLPKGDAIVSYQDPYGAASAIQCFHQRPMRGSILHVNLVDMAAASSSYVAVDGQGTAQPTQGSTYYDASAQMYGQQGYVTSVHHSTAYAPPAQQSTEAWTTDQGTAKNQRGGDAARGRGRKITAAPQGPARLFGPDDWPCPSCGNTNWARRPRCNMCGAPKPGTLDMKREGQAGGFKELDEEEIEEARRRRKALEEADDGELYDDYGRIKKKYRSIVDKATREQAALARLRGDYDPSPSGQELAALLGKEEEKTENAEAEERKSASPVPSQTSVDKTTPKKEEHLAEESRGRGRDRRRSPVDRRAYRRRSPSPRYRSRRRYPERPVHRPRDREDRYRSRR